MEEQKNAHRSRYLGNRNIDGDGNNNTNSNDTVSDAMDGNNNRTNNLPKCAVFPFVRMQQLIVGG